METSINEKNIIGPYFNTTFVKIIGLHPNQMTKDRLYIGLKNNLIKKFQNRCLESYGYVCKIYSIIEKDGGLIIPENFNAAAMYKVKFNCKLCRPLKNTIIVCEVKAINPSLIFLINGPIRCIIYHGYDQINKEKFTYDNKRDILIGHIDNNMGVKIIVGSFINVKCVDTRIQNRTKEIFMIGILDSVASQEEAEKANINKEAEDKLQFKEYDEYVQYENELVDEKEDTDETEIETETEI